MQAAHHHILVVEDNLGDFILVEDFIIDYFQGSSIKHAATFAEAKSLLNDEANHFDIVLLDLSLPDRTGVSLIQEIIALSADIPVVVLTGYSDFNFGVKSLAMGISDYLLKEDLKGESLYKSIIYSIERKRILLDLKASEKRARHFAGQMNTFLETERAHMAREIHDEFGQQLSGLKMSLSTLKRQQSPTFKLEEFVDALIGDLNQSIESVRRLANELRPVIIDKLGLFPSIMWLLSEFEKRSGCKTSYAINSEAPQLSKDEEINVFRICQEALTNIAKHAQASQVDIEIGKDASRFFIKIADNGKGLGGNSAHKPTTMGLMNMNERALLMGANLAIYEMQPKGTVVELSFENKYD